jgi:hypothetical protein
MHLSLELVPLFERHGLLRRRTRANLIYHPFQVRGLSQAPSPSTVGMSRAQPHTFMSTIVYSTTNDSDHRDEIVRLEAQLNTPGRNSHYECCSSARTYANVKS